MEVRIAVGADAAAGRFRGAMRPDRTACGPSRPSLPSSRPPLAIPRRAPSARTGAFSLIELLVVISIIAVLAGMLIPVINVLRETSRRSVCASQLRQVGVAAMAYAGEWDGHFPQQNPNPNWWSRPAFQQGLYSIIDYLDGNGRVLFCSGAYNPKNTIYSWAKAAITAGNWSGVGIFGYFYFAGNTSPPTWTDPPFDQPAIKPGLMPAFRANKKNLFRTNLVVTDSGSNPPQTSAVIASDAMYKFGGGVAWRTTAINHPAGGPMLPGVSGANVLHGDGHTEWYSYPVDIVPGGNGEQNYLPWKTEYVNQ